MTVINCHPQHKFLPPLFGLTLTNLKCQFTQTPLMVSLNSDYNSLTNFLLVMVTVLPCSGKSPPLPPGLPHKLQLYPGFYYAHTSHATAFPNLEGPTPQSPLASSNPSPTSITKALQVFLGTLSTCCPPQPSSWSSLLFFVTNYEAPPSSYHAGLHIGPSYHPLESVYHNAHKGLPERLQTISHPNALQLASL